MKEEGLFHALLGTVVTVKLISMLPNMPRMFLKEMKSVANEMSLVVGLRKGDKVQLRNLQNRPKLNGQTGVVATGAADYKTGRVAVLIDQQGDKSKTKKVIAVKPENLLTNVM
jgi:hypothetical protein